MTSPHEEEVPILDDCNIVETIKYMEVGVYISIRSRVKRVTISTRKPFIRRVGSSPAGGKIGPNRFLTITIQLWE